MGFLTVNDFGCTIRLQSSEVDSVDSESVLSKINLESNRGRRNVAAESMEVRQVRGRGAQKRNFKGS